MNEQIETTIEPEALPVQTNSFPEYVTAASTPEIQPAQVVSPQGCNGGCASEGAAATAPAKPSYVYAVGSVGAKFPTLSVEKEFAQAAGREDTVGKTDQETFYTVLSNPDNRYLIRQLCWVLTVQGMETYLLIARDPNDLSLFVDAIRPARSPEDIDVVIGMRGPMAPPEMCNGLMVPIAVVDKLYSFKRNDLLKAIPKPKNAKASQFDPAAAEVFDRIIQLTDNAGATDEHRALNYLAMRYPAIYAKTAEKFDESCSLTRVEVRPVSNGTRNMVDTIFAYTNRSTDYTDKYFVRVDVTEEFPFLVTKMSPYYDR